MTPFAYHKINNLPRALTLEQWRDAVTLAHAGAVFKKVKTAGYARQCSIPIGAEVAFLNALSNQSTCHELVGEYAPGISCVIYSEPGNSARGYTQLWNFDTKVTLPPAIS